MGIEDRIRKLEANAPDPGPDASDRPVTHRDYVYASEELEGRLSLHRQRIREEIDGGRVYDEDFDAHLYSGEALAEHERRVDEMGASLDEQYQRSEEWWQAHIREHRPDLVGVPNEIDERIEEARRELAEIRAEIAEIEVEEEAAFGDG